MESARVDLIKPVGYEAYLPTARAIVYMVFSSDIEDIDLNSDDVLFFSVDHLKRAIEAFIVQIRSQVDIQFGSIILEPQQESRSRISRMEIKRLIIKDGNQIIVDPSIGNSAMNQLRVLEEGEEPLSIKFRDIKPIAA